MNIPAKFAVGLVALCILSTCTKTSVAPSGADNTTVLTSQSKIRIRINTNRNSKKSISSVYDELWNYSSTGSDMGILSVGISTATSIQKVLEQKECIEIPILHEKLQLTPNDIQLDTKIIARELSCSFIQSPQNFLEEKDAMSKNRATFLHRWFVQGKKGSEVTMERKIINAVKYFVYTEPYGWDCGANRHFETFVGEEKISFVVTTGILHPCVKIDDATLDAYFDSLNIQISFSSSSAK